LFGKYVIELDDANANAQSITDTNANANTDTDSHSNTDAHARSDAEPHSGRRYGRVSNQCGRAGLCGCLRK
jgi:hypothetical protein